MSKILNRKSGNENQNIFIGLECNECRDEYEETLMNQRKMFDEEIEELVSQHNKTTEKLKKMHNDEKSKLEQQLHHLKESGPGEILGGTIKDAARCIEQCRTYLVDFLKICTYSRFIVLLLIFSHQSIFQSATVGPPVHQYLIHLHHIQLQDLHHSQLICHVSHQQVLLKLFWLL